MQAKLLRVLQEKEFERVGGNKTIQVKVRVLATTNRNLLEEVEKGKFREDLYYRLNVFPIAVPPLRERGDDILLLAKTFLGRHAMRHGIKKLSFSKSCEKAINQHSWPGNVRELENAVERAVILSDENNSIEPELLDWYKLKKVRRQVPQKRINRKRLKTSKSSKSFTSKKFSKDARATELMQPKNSD